MNECKRKCWDCGNVAIHEDDITPYVLCKKCGSQDTRLVREKPANNLGPGTSVKQCGPVAICCIKPEYSECIDNVMAAYRVHWEGLPINHRPKDPDDVYGFAYWLIRYSGFVVPATKESPNA